ncbi:hypothetical protein A2617_03430 [Candidatus Daviesbacteria bacterium RIFOXYD1_FULL_41_10]|uniref:HD domain-containing protein n=2 Tax=Candidatus Daviesiibacteriota TaxID=1752718 RepID=A0A1F5MYY2_9BACT|nr:MAG: Polynucleotide adenylyltransferase/metal dependent phosphohydrolase [Candidatus Daviesbacteria bacterium GW2011_GWB1_41_5]OGE70574.1 MAG: hypothetical protein A2617_03430 [Candidatus Daviesbacteria bacterium RIFOXYD1_FULL_41_10]
MDYKIPESVQKILNEQVRAFCAKFQKRGFQIYTVGGSVRDLLMGRGVHDWDFTTDATPEEILKLFPEGFYDNKFGTVGVKAGDVQIYEITTMRKEGKYEDFRHPEKVLWTNKIEEDLARRDFTINAIALRLVYTECNRSAQGEPPNFEIVDPYDGQEDIKNKLIRAVGDPDRRFKEDALRLIRAIRFVAQLGFEIEEKTYLAIKKNTHLISEVANERIRDELFKLLGSDNPLLGIEKMRDTGILQIILPEVEKSFGVSQVGPKHARVYDIGSHLFLTLKETPSKDPLVRLAALLHDIGKADTLKVDETGNATFYQHDVVGSRLALQIAKRFNLSRKQTDKLFRLVRWHLFTVDERQTDSAIRRFIKNVGRENIEDMMAIRIGDRIGGGTQRAVSWRMERFGGRIKQVLKKPFSISDLKINGQDVMKILNIPPSPKVGHILQKLFEEVLEDASKNNREYLLNEIKQLN